MLASGLRHRQARWPDRRGGRHNERYGEENIPRRAGLLPVRHPGVLAAGTYELRSALASTIINTGQLGGPPLALGLGLAAAVLSLTLTVLSLVAWHAFAGSLGVVPLVEVPLLAIVGGLTVLVVAGNLLAALPATMAARTRPAVSLHAE